MSLPPPTPASPVKRSRFPRWARIFAWAAGIFAAYTLIGFLVIPVVGKQLLVSQLGEALDRDVRVKALSFNPFTWEGRVEGLSVLSPDGQEMFGLDTLYADVESASVTEGGLVIRELRLEGPRLRVTRLSQGHYDVSDIIEELSKPSDSPPPRFSVSNIQVSGGKASFVDKPTGSTHTVADLNLRLPFLSNLLQQSDIFVEPHVSARINGAPLVLTGRSKPFSASHESELNLDLDGVEVIRYLPYLPLRLPVVVKSGNLDTELKLVFVQSARQPATLKLAGALHLRNLKVHEKGGAPLLAWTKLDLGIKEANLLQGHFHLDRLRLNGLEAEVRAGADGRLNWMDLADDVMGPPQASPEGTKKIAWSVDEVRLEDGKLRYQDKAIPDASPQVLEELQATVLGLSGDSAKALPVKLSARINGAGRLQAEGEIKPQPLVANLKLDLKGLPLLPFQPYFSRYLNISLTRGELSGQGALDLAKAGDGDLEGGFKGQLTLGDLHSVDKGDKSDFLKWKSLFAGDVDARLRPLSLTVGQVALSDFYARVIVTPQGKLNLMHIVRSADGPGGPEKAQEDMPIRIGRVSLQGGTVNFSDNFVKPNYTVNVTRIGGRVTGLASNPQTLADMELRGSYGDTAPVQVVAKLNPFAASRYLDLKGEIRGVDLTSLSPYSGKYAGYAIEKGKLSLYVTYHLESNQLTADNRVYLDQLAFGEKVNSPSATTLPVKLAIALLKNNQGVIDVNLPISGSIDDPEFSLGGVLVRVIRNLFVRAVTSPFAFLGSLFGGGEELSAVDFSAGRAGIDQAAVKKLQALAKAMQDRPALKLEITGRADPEADREGLKRAALERAVKAEKLKDLKKGGDSPEAVNVAPQEYDTYLRRAYKESKFPKPRNVIGLHKELPVEEMERLMLANLPVSEDDVRQLARLRAEVVQNWLTQQGKVPMERLFLLPPKLGGEGKADERPTRVDFSLR